MENETTKILEAFLNGEAIEKTYMLAGKIAVVFRDPSVKSHGMALRKHSEYVLSNDVTNIEASVYNDYCLLACYVRMFKDIDFIEKQGDSFSSKEGYEERFETLMTMINAPLERLLFDSLKDFQALVTKAFSDDSLKNS